MPTVQPSPEIEARAREILRERLGAHRSHTPAEWADALEQAERELLTVTGLATRDESTVDGIRRT